jgi:C-terminal domain found in long catalases
LTPSWFLQQPLRWPASRKAASHRTASARSHQSPNTGSDLVAERAAATEELAGASTVTERNGSDKTGAPASEGASPITASLESERVDSTGSVMTTNQGAEVSDYFERYAPLTRYTRNAPFRRLAADARTVEFLVNQYCHGKPILALGASSDLLDAVGISTTLPFGGDDAGLLIADSDMDASDAFIEAIARYRYPERETDPPVGMYSLAATQFA